MSESRFSLLRQKSPFEAGRTSAAQTKANKQRALYAAYAAGFRSNIKQMGKLSIKDGRKLIAKHILEKDVMKAITDYLDLLQIPYSVTNAEEAYDRNGNRVERVRAGWPDITGCYQGDFLAIEAKRGVGGVLSYKQAVELSSLHAQGALVCIPRSVDDVIELLKTKRVSPSTKDEIVRALAKGPKLTSKARKRRR